MQWSQIKTLFILCFLLLDVYLLAQFIVKQEKSDYEILTPQQASTIEDNLDAENIKIAADLPKGEIKGSYIKVKQQKFSEEAISAVKEAENQKTAVIDQEFIISKLEESITIPEDASDEQIDELVKANLELISSDSYVFWDWNKEANVLLFFQEKNDRPIYFNQNGIILVFLNDENEISFYTQTLLGEKLEQESQETLIPAIQAINELYQKGELNTGEEVTKVDIGFYTRLPLPDGPQVFAPTWKISVNNDQNYFVNAIEVYIFSSNDMIFLNNSIEKIMAKVNEIENDSELKSYLIKQLTDRLNEIKVTNRSESE